VRAELEPLARDPARSAILLDFDGTLSEIVARPELAGPVDGAREAVTAAAARFGLVAVISGRRTEDVASLLGVPGIRYAGQYGLEEQPGSVPAGVREVATAAAEQVAGAWVEDKGSSVAVHYRQAPDPALARSLIADALAPLAPNAGLELIEGKMVLELVPAGRPRKGGVVEQLVHDAGSRAAMYAGDDLADLEAYEALDRLRQEGVDTVKVAVRGRESWPELLDAADIVLGGPGDLVNLLRELAGSARFQA
jgi:trehalose 6-phosphate phosphatase